MYAIATCLASVLRGVTENEFGDEVDANTPIAQHIPMSIIEDSHRIMDPVSGTPRVIRTVGCFAPSNTDVTEDDRILDETHGVTYVVQGVTQQRSWSYTPDIELDLRQINDTPGAIN